VVFKAYDEARVMANTNLSSPFAGVPMLLKDILGFKIKKGWPNRSGSRFAPAVPSFFDWTLVVPFQAAGLIPLGKTNVPEPGALPFTEPKLYGPARNPWNLDHSTGGSSGGSAAAVAAGIVPLAHAHDGGGSSRIPVLPLRISSQRARPAARSSGRVVSWSDLVMSPAARLETNLQPCG
jgi:amidase